MAQARRLRRRSCFLPPRHTSLRGRYWLWMADWVSANALLLPRAFLYCPSSVCVRPSNMNRFVGRAVLFLAVVLGAGLCEAQSVPEDGGHELQIWTGGGYT